MPKKISSPTKKVGEPNEPRATALLVFSISFFLTSSCCARAMIRSMSMPGREEGVAEDLRIVHLLGLDPHVMVGGAEIGLEHALELRRNGAAHQRQRVDREERVHPELRDVVAAQEALGLERIVFRLVLDPAQRVGRRHVAGRLVDAAEQHRDVVELDAGALLDRRQHEFGEIGIGAAEIEVELDLERSEPSDSVLLLVSRRRAANIVAIGFIKFYFRTVNPVYTFEVDERCTTG